MRAGMGLVTVAAFVWASPHVKAQEPGALAGDDLEPEAPVEQAAPRVESPADEAPPADTWRWPGRVIIELTPRMHIPTVSSFDRALIAHAYGHTALAPALTFGVSVPIGVEWLWLGGRAGLRGRTWDHRYHDDASLVGVDLALVARLRADLGSRIELGLAVAGGLGWAGVWVNGAMVDGFAPRFDVAAELAFGIGRHFALGPRIGWDYFELTGLNRYGHSVDTGGFFFGLGLEGRE